MPSQSRALPPPAKRRRRAASTSVLLPSPPTRLAKPPAKKPPAERAAADDDADHAPAWERAREFAAAPQSTARRASLPVVSTTGSVSRQPAGPPRVSALKPPSQRASAAAAAAAAAAKPKPGGAATSLSASASASQPPPGAASRQPSAAPRTRSKLESFQTRLEALDAAKARIASLSSAVLANPRDHLAKLAELHALCARAAGGRPAALAILSQARVFADVAPGYRIRPITEKEAEVKVSKDIARLRAFESGLLAAYTRFVRFCTATARKPARGGGGGGGKRKPADPAVAAAVATRAAAAQALCVLLQALPHFNLADAIAPTVCAIARDRDPALRAAAKDALVAVLSEAPRASGPGLQTCVLIARELANAAERAARAVPDEAVVPLAAIPFHRFTLLPQSKKAKNEPNGSKRFNRNRRRRREMEKNAKKEDDEKEIEKKAAERELERDLREADAGQSSGEMYYARKSMLDSVCRAYFNIIKSASTDAEVARARRKQKEEQGARKAAEERSRRPPPALATALMGLLRIAAYVPPGVLDATLAALTPLLEGSRLPTATRLRSIAAAYAIVGANARASGSDAASFTADCQSLDSALYACLPALFSHPAPVAVEENLTWDAVSALLAATAFRSLPTVRAAALGRRLAIAAAGAPGHACSLALIRAAAVILPGRLVSCAFMQRAEGDTRGGSSAALVPMAPGDGDGVQRCDLDCEEADASGAERSAAWELAALQEHFHPAVREAAGECASGLCGERAPGGRRDIVMFAKTFSAVEGGLNPPPAERPTKQTMRRKRQASQMEEEAEGAGEGDYSNYFAQVFDERSQG